MARLRSLAGAIGSVTRLFSLAYILPALFALGYDAYDVPVGPFHVPRGLLVFAISGLLVFLIGCALQRLGRQESGPLRDREAYLTVGLGWLLLCGLATLPFLMEGIGMSPVDAFFEAMSGMTTTGATVMGDQLESAPKSIMVWRALLQFVGGMGIVVLSVAMLSKMTQGGAQLLQAEAPGLSVERIAPRLAKTSALLWTVYSSLAGVLFVVVFAVLWRHDYGLSQTFYETTILTFTTISTGGFGAHPDSIAYFHDAMLEAVLIVFMLASGMNYTLHYRAARGNLRAFWRDPEWRFYMGSFVVITLLITGAVVHVGGQVLASLRGAAFTVASLMTSTGFSTVDYDVWPNAVRALLVLVMITGATAGSTGGGIKHVRVLLLLKVVQRQLVLALHPRARPRIRLGLRTLQAPTIMRATAFVVTFVGVWWLGSFLLLAFDPSMVRVEDAASASVSALSNMGPGLGSVGPSHDFSQLTAFSKMLLAAEMWFGRLEIFAALVIFVPETWRH